MNNIEKEFIFKDNDLVKECKRIFYSSLQSDGLYLHISYYKTKRNKYIEIEFDSGLKVDLDKLISLMNPISLEVIKTTKKSNIYSIYIPQVIHNFSKATEENTKEFVEFMKNFYNLKSPIYYIDKKDSDYDINHWDIDFDKNVYTFKIKKKSPDELAEILKNTTTRLNKLYKILQKNVNI